MLHTRKDLDLLTSRFYNAVDIELEFKSNIVLISDCYLADYTIFDPCTDAVQCVGRFRNGVEKRLFWENLL